jgi:hypothetical protein
MPCLVVKEWRGQEASLLIMVSDLPDPCVGDRIPETTHKETTHNKGVNNSGSQKMQRASEKLHLHTSVSQSLY